MKRVKKCRTCRQVVPEKPVVEDQSRNGVRVIVYRYEGRGTVVDASCQCFGSTSRLHSSESCPVLLRARRSAKRAA